MHARSQTLPTRKGLWQSTLSLTSRMDLLWSVSNLIWKKLVCKLTVAECLATSYAPNPLDNVSCRWGSCQLVADLLATWHTILTCPDVANKCITSWQQVCCVVVVEFGKQHDTTDTTDFCPHQLVTDLLRRNWCNGFWPLGSKAAVDGATVVNLCSHMAFLTEHWTLSLLDTCGWIAE